MVILLLGQLDINGAFIRVQHVLGNFFIGLYPQGDFEKHACNNIVHHNCCWHWYALRAQQCILC